MDVKEFFEQSAGKWFSQRTSHYLTPQPAESGQSNMIIEILSIDAPEVIELCQNHNLDPGTALCGAKVSWEGTIEQDQQKSVGSTVLVTVPDSHKANEGQLLRTGGNTNKTPVPARYILGSDEALTIIAEDETTYSEERIWFASPNLRLRNTIFKHLDKFTQASIASEIRMGLTQPPKTTSDTAAKA